MLVGVRSASHCRFVTPVGLFQLQAQATTKRELPRRATGVFRLNTYNLFNRSRANKCLDYSQYHRRGPVNRAVRRGSS